MLETTSQKSRRRAPIFTAEVANSLRQGLVIFGAERWSIVADERAAATDFIDNELAGVLGVAGRVRCGRDLETLLDQSVCPLRSDGLSAGDIAGCLCSTGGGWRQSKGRIECVDVALHAVPCWYCERLGPELADDAVELLRGSDYDGACLPLSEDSHLFSIQRELISSVRWP